MSALGGYMHWVPTILASSRESRKRRLAAILEGFKAFRKKTDDPSIPYLSDQLQHNKKFQLVGFVPKVEYIKVDGPDNQMDKLFEHQHFNPMLMYKHKDLAILIITGPGLRWDKDAGISG